MSQATRTKLAQIAAREAQRPFHGQLEDTPGNLEPLVDPFPRWSVAAAERAWCAAFVYYCCCQAGFQIPYSPDECQSCSLAGCGGWEEFGISDERIGFFYRQSSFLPSAGDIVIYDRVFQDREHDHIGIVLAVEGGFLTAAEGNVGQTNTSAIVRRPLDSHIRAYLRLPDGYAYH